MKKIQLNHQQKYKYVENVPLHRPQRGLTVWELKQEAWFNLSCEYTLQVTPIFPCSAHVYKWLGKCSKYWFWGYKYIFMNRKICNYGNLKLKINCTDLYEKYIGLRFNTWLNRFYYPHLMLQKIETQKVKVAHPNYTICKCWSWDSTHEILSQSPNI